MPEAELKKLSYTVEQQLEYQLKKLLHQLRTTVRVRSEKPVRSRQTHSVVQQEIKLLKLEGIKNLSEDEAKLLLKSKVRKLSAADIRDLQRAKSRSSWKQNQLLLKSQNQEAESLRDQAAIAGKN